MTTDMDNRAAVYSRPAAHFDAGGALEVRASAALGCRRALWYAATNHTPTNPPGEEAVTAMEAGVALESVALRAMARAGWEVAPADSMEPRSVTVQVAPNLAVTGHPDATGAMPLLGGETVIEVKARGPEAFKRWRILGAERSHPETVAQVALYTYGTYGEARDAVIAVLDTGSRTWDYEVVPAERVERAFRDVCTWLEELAAHHARNGPDPGALPERDFAAGSRQCRACPFLDTCLPGGAQDRDRGVPETVEEVGDMEAHEAVAAYTRAQETMREPERAKRAALDTLRRWMGPRGGAKTSLNGRTVSLVRSKRYSVDYRRLNAILDPETRAAIVTESESQHVRVT